MTSVLETWENLHRLKLALLRRSQTVVQIGLSLPGGYSRYPWRDLFSEATNAVETKLTEANTKIDEVIRIHTAVGPVSLVAIEESSEATKLRMIQLEENTPRGRLWDLDVVDRKGPIDRCALGFRPRRCLVCGQYAHVCRKLAVHPQDKVIAAAMSILVG